MQEHHHVKTIPGEPVSPEIVAHAVHSEPGGHTQSEDINIPLVTIAVAFFAVFLAVVIVGLQAWFYSYAEAEHIAKQVPQGAPGTLLGGQLAQCEHELHDPPGWNDRTGYGQAKGIRRIPIESAINATIKTYAAAQQQKPQSMILQKEVEDDVFGAGYERPTGLPASRGPARK